MITIDTTALPWPDQWQRFLKAASHLPRLAPTLRDQLILENMSRFTGDKSSPVVLTWRRGKSWPHSVSSSSWGQHPSAKPASTLLINLVAYCCLAGFAVAQCINQHSSPSLSSPSPPSASGSPGGSGSTSHCDSGGSSSTPSATQSPAGIGRGTWEALGGPLGTL